MNIQCGSLLFGVGKEVDGMSNQKMALSLNKVSKSFGGVRAVRDFSLSVEHGYIYAVIGPNGAGKTTLFNLITGEIRLDSGSIRLFGTDITRSPIQKRTALGLGRSYQVPKLFLNLTVKENLFLSGGMHGVGVFKPWIQYTDCLERTEETAALVGLENRLETKVANLAHGEQRRLGIAMALAANPRIILLDEPAAGLTVSETELLSKLIKGLKVEHDLTAVLIDHDMSFVFGLADHITVMNRGSKAFSGTPEEARSNTQVQQLYYREREKQ